MGKLSRDLVVQSIVNLKDRQNKLWGLIALFTSTIGNESIKPNITYRSDSQELANTLQDLFFFGVERKEHNPSSPKYFRLSMKFEEVIQKYLPEEKKIDIADAAIFFYKNRNFDNEIKLSELITEFKEKLNLGDPLLYSIFKTDNSVNQILATNENYSIQDLFNQIKQELNITSEHVTLTFESPYTIAAHPSDFSRASFIQTLYSGLSILELILYSDINLDQYFPKVETSKQHKAKHLNTIYYGAPGSGKSYKIEKIIETIPEENKQRITFFPEYDYYSFVGGFKPITVQEEDGSESIKYKFVPQVFTNIYVSAWNDLDNDYYLVIEEINRGNCAEIFGNLFQLLDRDSNYSISPSSELKEYLSQHLKESGIAGIEGGKMKLPPNLIILASMNTSDQSLFPMDSAFKRRWKWEYVPINYEELNEDGQINSSYYYTITIDDNRSFKWIEFIEAVNMNIKLNPNLGMDKCIGNYFVKSMTNDIPLEEFVSKVVFYLWNDVFKDEENEVFDNYVGYEDFFPINTKGKIQVEKLLENLEVGIIS